MKATPLSEHPYFPMLLTNGRDAMLTDYSGSNLCGASGHTHAEQNQGNACGWYKTAHMTIPGLKRIQSILTASLQVFFFRGIAEPRWYEQSFDPRTATLTTDLTFWTDIRLRVTCFLDADSLWCQRIELLECPEDRELTIAFSVSSPSCGMFALNLPHSFTFDAEQPEDGLQKFRYSMNGVPGGGFMLCSGGYTEAKPGEIIYQNVHAGFTAWRILSAVDQTEAEDPEAELNRRLVLAQTGYATRADLHVADWNAYFTPVTVSIPDEQLQYLFDLSRYVVRGCQHPETGMLGLGTLPSLWGGGLYDCYDSHYAYLAMMRCGDRIGPQKYLESFLNHADSGREELKKIGINGTAFAGWDDQNGRFTLENFEKYVTHYKPSFSVYAIFTVYWLKRFFRRYAHAGRASVDRRRSFADEFHRRAIR